MIFAAFGNSPKQFTRLAEAIDQIAKESDEQFFIQTGHTDYPYKNVRYKKFLNQDEFLNMLQSCSVAILQGGWGAIAEASALGCRIIAVPRIMGIEHFHDQSQLVKALESQNVLIGCYDIKDLKELISVAKDHEFRRISKGNASKQIIEFILNNN